MASAERTLLASEIKYRRLFEAARDGILILDATSGEITAVNPFLTDLLGYSQDEILGKKLWELGPFKDIGMSRMAFADLQSREYIRYENLPLETSDGRSIAVEFVSNVYLAGDEKVIQCNIRDITARKATEEEQRKGEARYRTLFDHAPDGILIADRDSRYLDANASMCRMLGYSRAELIGLHASDIIVPSEIEYVAGALSAIIATSNYQREWQFRRRDGSVFAADVIATTMPDGNLLAMIRDVTERNLAVEALRAAEERMRFALDTAHVGIWDLDYKTGALQLSDTMEAQYGVPPGTFAGTFGAFLEYLHPDDRTALIEIFESAAEAGTDFSTVHRAIWPDGTVRWLGGAGRILLGAGGRPVRAVGISQDLTASRTLEEQFHQAQKMEAIGRLAGGVAHDFNNLLTVILGFCELLLADFDPDDRRQLDIIEIQKAGTHAAGLTRQLLAFSRKEIIEPTLLDLNATMRDLQPMLERLIGEDVKVVTNLDPLVGAVKADRGQAEQIILNLAVNARDAMPHGGTLRIETVSVDIDEHYATTHFLVKPGPYVALTVTDTGTGMTPDVQARLFEPFFTTKAVGKGTGLGLAVIHGVVARAGGAVNVYSEVGKGTTFKVYFPRANAAEKIIAPLPPVFQPPVGTQTVLVVEDGEGLRELTKRLLEQQGYTVLVAANADEARQVFEENPSIDVVLTDVVMPGGSGMELTNELLELQPSLKVIYMSGFTEDFIAHHGVLDPGMAFLAKPFTSHSLGLKIREALERPATG
jgi:two-component system, cell cycle sensor histidine kinase and response regulator CckA